MILSLIFSWQTEEEFIKGMVWVSYTIHVDILAIRIIEFLFHRMI